MKLADFDLACEGCSSQLIDLLMSMNTDQHIEQDGMIDNSTCLPGLSTEMAGTPEFLAPEVPFNNFLSLLSLCCLILDNFNLKCCS